jgi:AhpD family alkylhydroperoxidase
MDQLDEFKQFRQKMNEIILHEGNREINRFFALDTRAYEDGKLPRQTKELMGLTASIVLRCDDCIFYHILEAKKCGITREQFFETFSIALVVGGSIIIPHLRRAVDFLEQIDDLTKQD